MPDLDPNDPIDAIAIAWTRERPDTPVDSIPIVTRIAHAAKLFGDDRARLLRQSGADSAILDLLSTLRRAGPPYRLSTRELADAALVTAGAITQRVDRAVQQGLVIRQPRVDRSRQVDIELTESGHRTVEHLVDEVLGREAELLHNLTAAEREQLESLLRRLLGELHDVLGSDRRPPHVGG
ncbi:MarR family transcriptional regulator [Rhodococcus sp. 06-235-1A]|uniref:MarR family winged helix-turn-helix transcriptional regulator n=1 Tax=Rhodococcus sp. 06-235-1A TaxID=2022508 RepID=UPI000B9A916B|nr:MarR family transcriptional regulator [Rhodococcus sp. 06-235-1A]OZD08004.1 MarR family transcriptional regulator [Rhodococcus sp. 06-235-1A]